MWFSHAASLRIRCANPKVGSCVQNGDILRSDWVAGCENKASISVFSMVFFVCLFFNFTWSRSPICRGYCEMCRKYKIKFGGSTCFSQVISLTKQNQNLNNFKIKVYYSTGILYQGTHNVVVVIVFAFGVRRNGNVFARQRGASQVLVE